MDVCGYEYSDTYLHVVKVGNLYEYGRVTTRQKLGVLGCGRGRDLPTSPAVRAIGDNRRPLPASQPRAAQVWDGRYDRPTHCSARQSLPAETLDGVSICVVLRPAI